MPATPASVGFHKIVIGKSTGRPGGSDLFPVPPFTPKCVCCDAGTADTIDHDAGSSSTYAKPVQVPVCAVCRGHVPNNHHVGTFLFSMPVGLGSVGLLISIAVVRSLALFAGSALLVAVPTVLAIVAGRRRRAAARRGHHRDFLIGIGGGFSVVRTTNPRLAGELLMSGGRRLASEKSRD